MDDYTRHMKAHMDNWQALNLEFDGILTGFLGSKDQIELVLEFARRFKKENTLFVVDPVMGDGGKLYSSYNEELCLKMRQLLNVADVLTPNLTEVCQLLDIEYPDKMPTEAELLKMAQAIATKGVKQIVITGLVNETADKVYNYIYEQGKNPCMQENNRIPEEHSGTGDAFVAILTACLVREEALPKAVLQGNSIRGRIRYCFPVFCVKIKFYREVCKSKPLAISVWRFIINIHDIRITTAVFTVQWFNDIR